MINYDDARVYLIEQLSRDEESQIAGDLRKIGDGFDYLDSNLPTNDNPQFKKLYIAMNFWDAWRDARNHDWMYYEDIRSSDWPELAKAIVQDLKSEREITDKRILEHFDLRPRGSLIQKLKGLFKE
jgi:hypothetical protein